MSSSSGLGALRGRVDRRTSDVGTYHRRWRLPVVAGLLLALGIALGLGRVLAAFVIHCLGGAILLCRLCVHGLEFHSDAARFRFAPFIKDHVA
ncbi:hypothetical protein CERSUDRAFT_101494 [Gelatoporia subvermispora B]|uniref:Uncharacterized protein n=1 Tax=Ceriporiopsis subvermispora (strain B) TaxID=914234 RepID=M2Q0H0_CERS8|nr:hypothetical protein CERSUDRAFT_101494 [Gelatoporia subvermispora B]